MYSIVAIYTCLSLLDRVGRTAETDKQTDKNKLIVIFTHMSAVCNFFHTCASQLYLYEVVFIISILFGHYCLNK